MMRYTVTVEGMQCGMCEAHVNDAIRKAFPVKKVESSHGKNRTVVLTAEPIDEEALKAVINRTGYAALRVQSEPYEKKGLFSAWKK